MDEKLRRLLQEDMEKEADNLMEEVNKDPSLANVKAPEEIREKLFAQIREYEAQKAKELSEEDKELIRLGKIYKKRRKWNKFLILAAAMVLAMALGITSIGGPKRVFEEVQWLLGGKEQTNIDTDNERIEEPEGVSEMEAYKQIEAEFGFCPVKLYYLPDGVEFAEFIIEEHVHNARLLYEKKDKIGIYYYIQPNYRVGSMSIETEEPVLDEYNIKMEDAVVNVKKYEVEETGEERWMVDFEHKGTRYSLEILDTKEEEVKKIVENLYFS